jgi:hypothetical protein
MALHPKRNHWWHVTLYVTSRGLGTHAIPYEGGTFEIELDFLEDRVRLHRSDGREASFPLDDGLTVSDFHRELFAALDSLGVVVRIVDRPYDHESTIPFSRDTRHASYDGGAVRRYWEALTAIDGIFREFAGRSYAKTTPVHLYWHSFDLAVTRFSGRAAPPMEAGRRSDREAYSHEVISFGFWPGDKDVREAMFYSYVYPEPAGITERALEPAAAWWQEKDGSHLALLRYEDFRTAGDPRETLLAFLESAWTIGCDCAGWTREEMDTRPFWRRLDRESGSDGA